MQITRRAFSRAFGGVFGGALVPGGAAGKVVAAALPAEPGIDDAYEKLLSEYIRVEEAALAAGRTSGAQSGAATWEGQQLENFIAELDGRLDIKTTARQIYSEFKERLKDAARQARDKLRQEASSLGDEVARDVDEPLNDAVVAKADNSENAEAAADDESVTVEPEVVSGQVMTTDTGGAFERL